MKQAIVAFLSIALMVGLGKGQAQPPIPEGAVQLATEVVAKLERALQEVSLAWTTPTLSDLQVGAQRFLNLLVGENDPDYNPIAGDAAAGAGILKNTMALKGMLAETAWQDFVVTAESVLTFAGWAGVNAKAVLQMSDEALARVEVHKAEAFLRAALGCGEALPTKGGAVTILNALTAVQQP